MAKQITTTCDRCGKTVTHWDDRVLDDIQKEFPGKDFCLECFELIDLIGEIAKQAAAENKSPKQIAQEWLERYQS